MKKTILLNAAISKTVAEMGHTETLTIGDCGLPIHGSTNRIDLALKPGVPGFIETLETVLSELYVERVIIADEIKDISPDMHERIIACFGKDVLISYVSHSELKTVSKDSKAIIRTGECTAYANVILVSGVAF